MDIFDVDLDSELSGVKAPFIYLRDPNDKKVPHILTCLTGCIFSQLAITPLHAQDSENWNDLRVGEFIHWGIYSATEGAWGGSTVGGASEWIQQGANLTTSSYPSTLRALFTPSATWATDIASEAKAAGMEYVVITAKYHDGLALFNSTEYWSHLPRSGARL